MKKKSNRVFLASSIVSLACYGSYYMPTGFLPFLSLFSIAIPLVLTGNLLLLLTALLARKKWWVFPAISLLLGTNFILESYAFNTTSQSHDFSLLGYNVKSFREHKRYDKFSGELINWSVNESSDIKCFQEYSTNPRWSALDITSKMINNGYHAHVFKAKMEGDHAPGMAIFSKFPIIHRGLVWESIGRPNACIYSDVLIDKDTVRIYNIHLESMQLELHRLRKIKNLFSTSTDILSRIIDGTKKHSQQIEQTIQHCLSSPYPLCPGRRL
ncbi:hypothetical protein [Reichenbachiella ulvae]|uniref:Uncharacterized protein n=1 Tax=Reichenbachiella ulvae TaxID=2980104 RepID=A0ABT3CPR1_9BACT|nr:hypothetical protein [Reichenbachiella ulvae]MCV9385721.1 hypothetical protein [Reichenbachiella ulvae]